MTTCTPKKCEQLYDTTDKWKVSILFGAIFAVVSSPFLYTFMAKLNRNLATIEGCPSLFGLIVNTVIFISIVRVLLE